MNGVRVQGISPQCPKKMVWQYFINLCGDGSTITDVYYPVLNNDAIIIFRDVSVATKILTSRHDKWNVLPLPNQVFSKQRVWLEKDLTDLLIDQEHHLDILKNQAQVEVSMDNTTRQIMLTGHTYQIEWAWRYLSNLQDQQEHPAAMNGAATPAMANGNVLTNRDVVHTSMRDRSHAGHSSLAISPRTHHPSRFQNGDVVSTSDVRSLAVEGVSSSGRRLPSPGGREMSRDMAVDPSVTSLAIEGLDRPRPSQGATSAARSSGTFPSLQERSPLNAGSSKPMILPIKAFNRDADDDDSRPSLAAAVVEDSEQRDHLTSLNSCVDRHLNGEHGVSAYSSLPVSNFGGARSSPESANAEAPSYGRKTQAWSTQTGPSSSSAYNKEEAELRASRQQHSASRDMSPAPYDDDADCGAVGGAGPPSLRPEYSEDADYDDIGSKGVYGGQRAFSSLTYHSSSSLRLPSNNKLALLNRSVVELSRKHFQMGHRLKLKIYVDDITKTKTDAVVNAANWELKNVGGVAGALAKAAGVEMERECERIYRERGALRTAQVVKTKAYGRLSHLKYVLHTVGPIFRKEDPDKSVFELAQTFLNCLQFAEKLNLESVTFPFISTGIFGMPIEHCIIALFTALHKYSYERNSGLARLEEVHFINNDIDSVCNAVLCAESTSRKENMDTAVKRMLEGEKLYSRSVFPFCDQNDHPKNKPSTSTSSRSSVRSSTEDRYGTWDSTSGGATAAAAAADDNCDGDDDSSSSSSRSVHHSGQRISRQDQHAAGPQSMSAINRRSRPQSGSTDRGSRTVMTGSGSNGISSGTTKVRESSPMPRQRSRSNSMSSANRGSDGTSSKQGSSTASGSSSTTSRAPPVIKQSLVPNAVTSGKKRSMSLVKSVGKGRTTDHNSGNDTDQSSTAASETEDLPDRMCAICLDDPMKQPKRLPCGHQFCTPCVDRAMVVQPRCPKCQRLFGIPPGTQPRSGTMTYTIDYTSNLPGWAACGTITITYDFPSGIQEACHPNPGRLYEGTHRVAYLPACPEGREVLKLLQKAFDHRLVFTIGNSVTTGKQGVITWNDVHHKTSTYGGPSQFGYPDPDYLHRVKEELASKGITHP